MDLDSFETSGCLLALSTAVAFLGCEGFDSYLQRTHLQLSPRQSTPFPSHLLTRRPAACTQTFLIACQLSSLHPSNHEHHYCVCVPTTRPSLPAAPIHLVTPTTVLRRPANPSVSASFAVGRDTPFLLPGPDWTFRFRRRIHSTSSTAWRHKIHISMTRRSLGTCPPTVF